MKHLVKVNPLLKLLFPLILGIVLSWLYGISLLCSLSLFVFSLCMLFIGLHSKAPRLLFGVAVSLSMLAVGCAVERLDAEKMSPRWSGAKGRFEAQLCEEVYGERGTVRLLAQAERIGRDSIPGARRKGLIEIAFANSADVEKLSVGDRIFFEAKVEQPRNAGNPAEFDVEHYMYVQGVTGQVYLPVDGWRRLGEGSLTLSMRALKLRDAILAVYDSLHFGRDELAVLSALTVGEKRGLSRDLRDAYSVVGASHILALSGLHLGILYMILTLMLPVRAVGASRFIRELSVLLVLWTFAFVAGLSPSVVRAAILFSLMSFGRLMRRDTSSMNSLAFAALLMLVVSPRLLFDISFQLSFSAVAAILLLNGPLCKMLRVDGHSNRVYDYIVQIITVSLAAQIGTLPFIWHYFGTFPLYFLLTNFVAVPLAFVIMLLAVIMLALTPLPFVQEYVAQLLNSIIGWMNGFFSWVAQLPGASFKLPYLDAVEAALLGLFILVLLFAWGKRKWLIRAGALVSILLLVLNVLPRGEWPSQIVFYNSRGFSAAQLFVNREKSYLLTSYPSWEVETRYIVGPFCERERLLPPVIIENGYYKPYNDEYVNVKNGLVTFAGRRIALIADEHWGEQAAIVPVDCIWLCRGFLGSIEELLTVYPSRYVILDATLYQSSRERVKRECRKAGVRYIDLLQQGAVKMLCEKTGVRLVSVDD